MTLTSVKRHIKKENSEQEIRTQNLKLKKRKTSALLWIFICEPSSAGTWSLPQTAVYFLSYILRYSSIHTQDRDGSKIPMGCLYPFSSANKHHYERASHVSYSSHPTHLPHSSCSISDSGIRHVVYSSLIRNYFLFSPKTGDFSQQLLGCVIYEYATMTIYGSVHWVLLIKQFKDSAKMGFLIV